jgi:hypothetical protein
LNSSSFEINSKELHSKNNKEFSEIIPIMKYTCGKNKNKCSKDSLGTKQL